MHVHIVINNLSELVNTISLHINLRVIPIRLVKLAIYELMCTHTTADLTSKTE